MSKNKPNKKTFVLSELLTQGVEMALNQLSMIKGFTLPQSASIGLTYNDFAIQSNLFHKEVAKREKDLCTKGANGKMILTEENRKILEDEKAKYLEKTVEIYCVPLSRYELEKNETLDIASITPFIQGNLHWLFKD